MLSPPITPNFTVLTFGLEYGSLPFGPTEKTSFSVWTDGQTRAVDMWDLADHLVRQRVYYSGLAVPAAGGQPPAIGAQGQSSSIALV